MKLPVLCLIVLIQSSLTVTYDVETRELHKKYERYEDIELYPKRLLQRNESVKLRDALEGGEHNGKEDKGSRLPRTVRPLRYDLRMQVYPWRNSSLLGTVVLQLEALQNTSTITLHSKELIVHNPSVKVTDSKGSSLSVRNIKEDVDQEFLILSVDPPLKVGQNYTLTIPYTGVLGTGVAGVYHYGYEDKDKVVRMVVATQFQPTSARTAFPCMDEPELKARFTLHLARPANSTALSNTPLLMTAPFPGAPDYKWDTFEDTVPMSTYLLAFVVTQFRSVETTRNGVQYRVFMNGDHFEEGQFALQMTPKFVEFFRNFYSIEYPFRKLDSVGLKEMGAAGMENWGLITYLEDTIRSPSTSQAQISAANLIAHEVAHQWFGNLVTAHWWSDIWLNEGFATYMALRAIQEVEPLWQAIQLFVSGHQMAAMALDSMPNSKPVIRSVSTVNEISSSFNKITYSKGASLIRMMDHFLTEKTFQRGVMNYLNEFRYSSASQDDLWRHLTAVAHTHNTLPSGVTAKEVMDTWTLQRHYPLVTMRRHDNGSCTISQRPFLSMDQNSSRAVASPSNELWWIPVSVLTEGSPEFDDSLATLWLPPKSKDMFIAGLPNPPQWVILNNQQSAYARINYDNKSWMSLIRQLTDNHTVIPTVTRAQLLDDAYHLFIEGELDNPDVLFSMMSYMKNEENYLPWVITIRNMEDIHDHLQYHPEYFELKTYLLKLSSNLYPKFGLGRITHKTSMESLLSARAQKWACSLDQPACTDDLKQFFNYFQAQQDIRVVPPNLRKSVMCVGIKDGNSTLWDAVWKDALAMPVKSSYRANLLKALGCSKEPWTLKRYLLEAFKRQPSLGVSGVFRVVEAVSQNPVSHEYAWEIIKQTDVFKYRFPSDNQHYMIISAATKTLDKRRHLDELEKFARENPFNYTEDNLHKIVQPVRRNLQWLERYHQPIAEWLVHNYPYDRIEERLSAGTKSRRKAFRKPRKLDIKLIV